VIIALAHFTGQSYQNVPKSDEECDNVPCQRISVRVRKQESGINRRRAKGVTPRKMENICFYWPMPGSHNCEKGEGKIMSRVPRLLDS
jgi:hypothetical protein